MADFAAADAALDEVIAEQPTTGQDSPVADEGAPAGQDVETVQTAVTDPDQWLCTEDEARGMVDRARAAVRELDDSIRAIVERRAWEPLGYDNPRDFVLTELGPNADGGKSRAQAYRLARMAMFLYNLAEAFGEDTPLPDMLERAQRAIPPGPNGENDEVLAERIVDRASELDSPSKDEMQSILDEEQQRARQEIEETGRLARKDETPSDGGEWDGAEWDDLTGADDEYADDDFSLSDVTPHDAPTGDGPTGDGDGDEEPAEDAPEWETQASSRMDYVDAHGVGDKPSGDALTYVAALRDLMSALSVIEANQQYLPDIVEYASDEEITKAASLAHVTQDMTDALIKEAETRDDGFLL